MALSPNSRIMRFVAFAKRFLVFCVCLFLLTLIYNTLTFSSKQIAVPSLPINPLPENALNRFAEAIRIPTISHENGIDTSAFIAFQAFLAKNYPLADSFLQKQIINGYSIVYAWQGKNAQMPPILLLGHIDVVPIENLEKWTAPPFSGIEKDGYIWGRGSLDDKVNVLGIMESVEQLLKENYTPERSIYIAFGHDEEIGGLNGAKAIAAHFQKNNLSFEYVLDEGSIALEKALAGLSQPLAMIGIAEKGFATFELTATLPDGGHSAMPPKESAIGILSKAIFTLEQKKFPLKIDGITQSFFEHVGPEMSLPYRILFSNLSSTAPIIKSQLSKDATTSALLQTTIAPTILQSGIKENVLPTSATAKVNLRILPGETTASAEDFLKKTIADDRISIKQSKSFASNPSQISDIKSFGYKVIQKTIHETFEKTAIAPSLVIAGTDSRHYEPLCKQIFRFTPVLLEKSDLKRLHGVDERLSKREYQRSIQFYYQLIKNSSF